MNRGTYVVAGILGFGIVGAMFILFLRPVPMDGVTMPMFSTGMKMPYVEIVDPSGFVNTEGITIGELIGKKIVLVDFMTYSCINCQRTFPYLVAWYGKYKDQGLEIVGIHTPEFAFEKDIDNVRKAMAEAGITYPVVLDNDYATWRAWGNQYWPRKYLIDIHGNVIYDHAGEGQYVETEMMIRRALQDRALELGMPVVKDEMPLVSVQKPEEKKFAQSPEVYFGSERNELLASAKRFLSGTQTLSLPTSFAPNALYLGGTWNFTPEYAESASDETNIIFHYKARDVYFVGSSGAGVTVEILQDGKPVGAAAGGDVAADGTVMIKDERLYKLIRNPGGEEHVIQMKVKGKGLKAFTFTFG